MKSNLILILNLILIGFVSSACSDKDNSVEIIKELQYPLNVFKVKVGDSYYHGKIDQKNHIIEVGGIVNGNTITDVEYILKNSNTTISPEPSSFIRNWKNEQSVVIITDDNTQTAYTIRFPKLEEVVVEPEEPEEGIILFKDDFNIDGNPDPTKWVLSPKGGSDWNDEMSGSYDQAYVKDGKLMLVAEKVGGEYRAGGIETNGKFDFTFGKVEVRAKIARYPNGAFPAVWMMPKKFIYGGWPDCGEIDIMEHIKQDSYIYQTIHTHYTYTLGIKNPSNSKTTVCDYSDFNTYGVEWTEDKITFFVNGQETMTYPNLRLVDEVAKRQWPFTKDASFYLILNMGLGGDRPDSWTGRIDDNNLPAIMEVDWVKVTALDE